MKKRLKVANGSGFWGDALDAPRLLVRQQPDLDYLTLDYLAELSLSIMATQRMRYPEAGYARDVLYVVKSLAEVWQQKKILRLVTNAGGLNPSRCGRDCMDVLKAAGCRGLKVGIVSGDDVLPLLKREPGEVLYRNLETGESLQKIEPLLLSANAYLGAKLISEALTQGCQIVITGRVADPSLTVGPCMAHYQWDWRDYQKLAGATVAGHLIECGTQVTGGISSKWLSLPDLAHIGFPIAEIDEEGGCILTKPAGTGGAVTVETVKEQLVYEIGNPAAYLSPDVSVSFLGLQVRQEGENRVEVTGAVGSPPPLHLKVSASYHGGYRAEGQLLISGPLAREKAERCAAILLERVRDAGYCLDHSHLECFGDQEVFMRLAVLSQSQEAVEKFATEIAPMVTSGPPGVTGYATGRPKVRRALGYWPCLVAREAVAPQLEILEVS